MPMVDVLILRVDDAAAKHIARDGVNHIFLLTPNLVDIAREQRHAAHQSLVDPLGEEVAMHIVGVQDRQLFQVLHILPPIPPHTVFLFSKSSLVFSSRVASCKHSRNMIELQNNLFASRTLPTLPYHFFYTIFFHPCLSPKSFKLGT